jgi:hypothetical protein
MALHSMDYLLRPLEDDCEDYSSEGPDWIDEALAKGFGFKSEEEKKAYLYYIYFSKNISPLILIFLI